MSPYEPLVSIVIPVYNGADYLTEAIESALNQTYQKTEVLVVDDGSDDGGATRRAVDPYLPRIWYLSKENGGVSSALNLAVREMRGEWLSWLSHDDLYRPGKVAQQVRLLDGIPAPERSRCAVFCDEEPVGADGKPLRFPTRSALRQGMNARELVLANMKRFSFNACAFLIPKAAFQELGGFREDLRAVQDMEFLFRLLFAGYAFHHLPEALVSKRVLAASFARRGSGEYLTELGFFFGWVTEECAQRGEFADPDFFLRLGLCMESRGFCDLAGAAFTRAERLRGTQPAALLLPLRRVEARAWGRCRACLRRLYIRYLAARR